MKININKSILLRPLDQVSKALPNKTTIPILSEIFFSVDEEGLTLVAGDTSTSIKAIIPSSHFENIETGSITLPGKKIVEIIKKMKEDIVIETQNTTAIIKSGKSKFELSGMAGDEYPEFPKVEGENITLTGETLKKLVAKTLFATSRNESTPILTGLLFRISEGNIRVLACDRHRLSRIDQEIENGIDLSVVIKSESISELNKMTTDKDEIELSFQTSRFLAKTKDYTFYSSVLEGTYPETSRMIPTTFNTVVTVSTDDLIEALERANVIASIDGKTHLVVMTVDDEIKIVSNPSGGVDKVVELLEHNEINGEGFTIAMNAKYALEALKAIDSEETTINFVEPMSPIILKGADNENNLQLILPYRT